MDKNLKTCSSYSDLFEDFFRTDSSVNTLQEGNEAESILKGFISSNNSSHNNFNNDTIEQQMNDQVTLDLFFQQQQTQNFPAFYQTANSSATAFQSTASIQKPGFVRNRTRRNMRQKSVASAVRANHIINAAANQVVNVPVNGYPLMYQHQQSQHMQHQQIPYYQAAAQIPTYQPHHQQQSVLLAKSPVVQAPITFMRSSQPSSPASARSPNSNSSDYVKMKLQQKIRSRMVSKGQIPPNPTEDELRMCGVQMPQQQMVTVSQLPTPKSSPRQIPRAFNNNTAAFIAAPIMMISNQIQQDAMLQDDMMKYFDLSGSNNYLYSQKDPFSIVNNPSDSINMKQQQQQQQHHQQQHQSLQTDFLMFNPQSQSQDNLATTNYDQFFSDFILY